ncbi:DUF2207 domain-containing protein [Candidatus Parcubacteria bacterium]|nr:MAG: DUF2207 domain-containing protein [Candidatus Parcubacteria bacterium]
MRRLISTIITVFSIGLFFSLTNSPVFASENWVIDSFDSQINIQENGKVEVTENIDVDFGFLQKHGIFRDIPYIYYSDNGTNIYTEIELLSVSLSNAPVPVRESKIDNYIRLQIGDADKTISGKQRYQIKYLAMGVLRGFEDYDEFYWDVTGNGWPVPITQASAVITLPESGLIKATCFQGEIGSKKSCNYNLSSLTQAEFTTSAPLNATEGLTIVVGYKKGLVPIIQVSPPPNSPYFSREPSVFAPNILVFLITSIIGVGFAFWWWKKKGKEESVGAIMVEYSPPDNLRPAEVGTLLDERADTLDVSATIIDLAVRGFLAIEEKEKKWLFGSTDYVLTKKLKDQGKLLDYEKELLDRIFIEDDTVKLSELKNQFYDDLSEVKKKLYKDVVDKNYFPTNPENVKIRYMVLGLALLTFSAFVFYVGLSEPYGVLSGLGLGLIVLGLFILILSRSFAKRTTSGNQTFKKILGFKLFMEKVEVYKQRFMEKENLFNELLPYAIVFGITEKFAQAFKDLGLKPSQPNWYISNRPFNPILFSSNINNFSRSLTSAIASRPSSKHSFVSSGSGFGGGGSSGGGFGGGGGGSW